ncbi:MAG TPA: Ig-like domain-containing protein [Actinomycetota bacterium]|nr:Ig-like domain-containing protein [Actinomycetota bacterium]
MNDAATRAEDSAATAIDVLANDPDPDGGTKLVQSVTQPANGTVVNGGGNVTYQPNPNYCNTPPGTTLDTFTYTLNGGSSATVTVNVTCVDDNPTAVDDGATVSEDSAATAIDVLANDTDPDGGAAITIGSVSDPANGAAAITGGGTGLNYQPDANFCGSDSFTYTVNGGSTATVSVTVTCVADPATAVNDAATVLEDSGATAIDVLANDTDPDDAATIQSATQPANGTVTITGASLSVSYQPDAGYCNSPPGTTLDTFTYTLNGGSSATVAVTVTCVVDNPTAVNDSATVAEDAAATAIDVLANDTDPDGNAAIQSVGDPANGTAVITGGGSGLTYQPDANYCNTPPGTTLETFAYTLNGGSSATVTVTVTCVVDNPTAVNDTATVLEDATATSIDVLANDTDPDGAGATVQSVSDPANGTAVITGGGTGLTYQPDASLCGPDTFTYTLNGGSVGTVSVTVTCVNDAPSFTEGADQTAGEDAGPQSVANWATAISRGPANESGQAVTFEITNNTNASLFAAGPSVSSTGTLTYTPAANQNGTATITLRITDDGGTANGGVDASATQTFVITVTAVNDAPVAQAKSFSAQTNMKITGLGGLLTGVTDADSGVNGCTPSFTVASVGPTTTPAGGTISNVNAAAGTFDFDPPPGVTGNVTFSYTVQDTGCPGSATSAPATITVSVSGPVIWFVDDNAAAGGDGRLSSPFNTLAGAAAVDAANHRIFLHDGAYATGIALSSGEWLVGQGVTGFASFDALMGITPPTGTIARPTIGTGAATVQGTVTLNTGAFLRALVLSTGASAGLNDTGGAITGVDVAQTSVATTTGTAVALSDIGGAITLTGLTTNGGSGATLTGSNAAATFAFTGVTVSSGVNPGISSSGGGTLTVTGTANTLTSTTGTALNVTNTTIAAGGLTFRSISSNGAASGIVLNNTGSSGGLTVAGTGVAGTGGTIQGSTGPGISLTSTSAVSLASMNITGGGADGISGSSVAGLSLTGVQVSSNGNAVGEAGIDLTNLLGTSTWSSVTVTGSAEDNVVIRNSSGALTLAITSSTFSNNSALGNDGFLIDATQTASVTVSVTGSTFSAHRGDHFQAAGSNSASLNVVFSGNTLTGGHPTALGQGITINVATGVAFGGYQGSVTYDVNGNTINGAILSAITVVQGTSAASASVVGRIRNNTIGTSGVALSCSTQAYGVYVDARGNGAFTALVTNNIIRQCFDRGIQSEAGDGSATVNLTVQSNTIDQQVGALAREAIQTNYGITSTNVFGVADAPTVCLQLGGAGALANVFSHGAGAPDDFRLRKRFGATVRLPGYAGGTGQDATSLGQVVAFVQGQNTGSAGEPGSASASGAGGGYTGGGACLLPP